MRRSSVPRKRKFQGFNWIAVEDEHAVASFRSTQSVGKNSVFSSIGLNEDIEAVEVPEAIFHEKESGNKVQGRSKGGSVIPRPSNFVNYNFSKYYCPYYIKPQHWEKINAAPRFDEGLETQKIHNFYKFMHTESSDPNPFSNGRAGKSKNADGIREKLAELPSIQKYKTYLIEKKIRLPAFLNDT